MEEQLKELDQKEQVIVKSIASISGSVDFRENEARRLGLFDQYVVIHDRYTNMDCVESLKRAIFIQWYASVEPQIYTGISALNEESETRNISKLIELIDAAALDDEFTAMISYYYTTGEWYFSSFKNWTQIEDLVNKEEDKLLWKKVQKMNNRGQMGIYWNSLNRN